MTLVDASAWVAFLRASGSNADRALQRLLAERAHLQTTDTVILELLAGAGDEGLAGRLERLLGSLDRCAPAGPLDLERAARLFRVCRDAREPVGSLSVCLVAAVALRDDLEILTEDPDLGVLARLAGVRLHGGETPPTLPRPIEPAARPSPGRTRPVILVVEDEASAARILEDALEPTGGRVILASTAADARRRMAEEPPNVLVLDLILPDEDGRTLLADLRRDRSTHHTGVVVVTGKAGPRTREECFALGADAFLAKPFDVADLSTAVEHILVEGRTSVPDPDPLHAPLTLSEVQKALTDEATDRGDHPWTVGLVELHAHTAGGGALGGGLERDGAADLLPHLLRTTIGAILPRLTPGERLARWGVDQLVLVTPSRSEEEMRDLLEELRRIPQIARHLTGHVRSVGRDEDLLDAVSIMASQLGATPPTTAPGEIGRVRPRGRPRAVLVEDDPITAGLVRHRLERSGFVVEHLDDGGLGLEALLASPPDVAILDVQLPAMDGFEILRRLREREATRSVPVLMFTSLGRQEHVQRGFELGADDYVTKPFSPTELLTRVLRLVRRR